MTITQTIGSGPVAGFWSPAIIAALISAATALSTGLIVSFFSWRQWLTAREKLVLDLFDRRLANYSSWASAIEDRHALIADSAIGSHWHSPSLSSDPTLMQAATVARLLFGRVVYADIQQLVRIVDEMSGPGADWETLHFEYLSRWAVLSISIDDYLMLDQIGTARRR